MLSGSLLCSHFFVQVAVATSGLFQVFPNLTTVLIHFPFLLQLRLSFVPMTLNNPAQDISHLLMSETVTEFMSTA
jgi:hypothetical protein